MSQTVAVRLAGGYLPQIASERVRNPGLSQQAVIQQWVTQRYGGWISDNLSSAYEIQNVDRDGFDIQFENPDEASQFVKLVGGALK
ncbi:hypothetical protein [Pararhizobium mangrovi]|uniref:Uncharacterized protein n=1 Tax=Pararhizobium mangrovi TaxID=2590452 RepID=A0A506TUV6_9HYPH|nr:hypothetical protein [Pararhizobium mangrovi]TPW25853.1 hypothetical protein FJU11_17495 [Pararhizobium mangrovi]